MGSSDIKKYHKKYDYSYCMGAFPTFELIQCRSKEAESVYVHSKTSESIRDKIIAECQKAGVPVMFNDRVIEKVRDKESCLLLGIFYKYEMSLVHGENHVVLVNPSDSGNLGTIMRTCVGFGIKDLAVIEPAVDMFNPKTIRASMGAIFHMNVQYFNDFSEYEELFGGERICYPFMLKGEERLGDFSHPEEKAFSLIFGNEATGLDDGYLGVGRSVRIAHSEDIDSLNLSLATGIGIYEFTKNANF